MHLEQCDAIDFHIGCGGVTSLKRYVVTVVLQIFACFMVRSGDDDFGGQLLSFVTKNNYNFSILLLNLEGPRDYLLNHVPSIFVLDTVVKSL